LPYVDINQLLRGDEVLLYLQQHSHSMHNVLIPFMLRRSMAGKKWLRSYYRSKFFLSSRFYQHV